MKLILKEAVCQITFLDKKHHNAFSHDMNCRLFTASSSLVIFSNNFSCSFWLWCAELRLGHSLMPQGRLMMSVVRVNSFSQRCSQMIICIYAICLFCFRREYGVSCVTYTASKVLNFKKDVILFLKMIFLGGVIKIGIKNLFLLLILFY